jgi:hypothetical protein
MRGAKPDNLQAILGFLALNWEDDFYMRSSVTL